MEPKEITEIFHIDNTSSWDSLAHLRLIIEIESKFKIYLDPVDIQSIIDYQSVYKIVNKFLNK